MCKCTNLDIKDAACLYIVHILQHPTSRATILSRQTTIVTAVKKNFPLHPGEKYGKSTKPSPQWCHQVNECKSELEEESVRPFGPLRSVRCEKKFGAITRQATYFFSNEEKENWIEDDVECVTAVARKRVQDTEAPVQKEQENRKRAENARLTNREPKRRFWRWWLLSETVWVIMQVLTIGRMGQMWMMKRQSWAS